MLQAEYPATAIRGDGQVVVVPFATFKVEVVPAFATSSTEPYLICDTNDGGCFKFSDPKAEIRLLDYRDGLAHGDTRNLIRMLKVWQRFCNVPGMKSFYLELLAQDFLSSWEYVGKSSVYYDWMCRDFFTMLLGETLVCVPGTNEIIYLGDAWKTRAESARAAAVEACEDDPDYPHLVSSHWQKIFGTDFPYP